MCIKTSVKYYNRPLNPNSSTGEVCSGVPNTEDAGLLKTVTMESGVSFLCMVHPRASIALAKGRAQCVAFCDPPLGFASLCLQEIPRPPLGKWNDSVEIFKQICSILTVTLVCPQESFYD